MRPSVAMFTTASVTRSNIDARLGTPCSPAAQGSAAATLLENNAQTTKPAISIQSLITGLQAELRFGNRCLSTVGIKVAGFNPFRAQSAYISFLNA
jgi:hypothetical protein